MNRAFLSTSRIIALASVASVVLVAPARAQSPGTSVPTETKPGYWEAIGGFEADTHGTGYGFLGPRYNHPISDSLALTARVYGTYLFYEFENDRGGTTTVRSPGFSPSVGLRFGRKARIHVAVGLSSKHEDREITDGAGRLLSDTSRWRTGVNLGGDLYWDVTRRTNFQGIVSYGTEDEYLWTRAAVKRQVTNFDWKGGTTWGVGVEGIAQGNEDITSRQIGALAEVVFVPSRLSLMFRGGFKHSTFEFGPDKNGPYFGVGLYKRF